MELAKLMLILKQVWIDNFVYFTIKYWKSLDLDSLIFNEYVVLPLFSIDNHWSAGRHDRWQTSFRPDLSVCARLHHGDHSAPLTPGDCGTRHRSDSAVWDV